MNPSNPILNGPLWRDLVFMGCLATVIVVVCLSFAEGGFGALLDDVLGVLPW